MYKNNAAKWEVYDHSFGLFCHQSSVAVILCQWAGSSVRVVRVVAVGRGTGGGRVTTVPVPVSLGNRKKNKETKCQRTTWALCLLCTYHFLTPLFFSTLTNEGASLVHRLYIITRCFGLISHVLGSFHHSLCGGMKCKRLEINVGYS